MYQLQKWGYVKWGGYVLWKWGVCHAMCSDSDEYVRKNVATLIREIVRHTPEVCMACMITKQSKVNNYSMCNIWEP